MDPGFRVSGCGGGCGSERWDSSVTAAFSVRLKGSASGEE